MLSQRETQSRLAQPLVLEGSTQQAAFIVVAPPQRRCRCAQPFGSLFYQPSQRPKEFVCRSLGKAQFSKQPFLSPPTSLPPTPLPPPLLKLLAAPQPLAAFLSVSAVSKTQRGCLAQPRIPSSKSSLEIYFLEFLLRNYTFTLVSNELLLKNSFFVKICGD